MPSLQLVSIKCHKTEDSAGHDEAYIKVAGNTVWSGDINNGQSFNLENVAVTSFSNRVDIELFDGDTGVFDSDDFLGRHTATAAEGGAGEKSAKFTEDEADYTITYRVVA